jgi:sterol desaturase/sphingolipid hydroxylase (fatty acid hydroxylase superfamily)
MTAAWTFLRDFLERVEGPDTPLYLPFVASSFFLMVCFLVFVGKKGLREALLEITSPRVWLTRSTRTDVVITFVHEMFVAVPMLALATYVSERLFVGLRAHVLPGLGGSLHWHAPMLVQSAIVTALMMLAIDLGTFLGHRLLHAFPVLWEIHAVHHSAEQLTFLTTHRVHPLEPLPRVVLQGLLSGSALAAVDFFFGGVAPVVSIWGLGAGFFVFSFTNDLLHAPVPVRYPRWLRTVIISPHLHHLHHSRMAAHRDRNFGAIFSIWDRLCGTYQDVEFEAGEVKFGLAGDDPFKQSLVRCYLYPLVAPFERLLAMVRRRRLTSP